jgi:tripartite-type tricarboxylate transporter receptor subunit TctC
MSIVTRILFSFAAAALAAFAQPAAAADDYPAKPVRIVVPFPAGGSIDMVARLLAERLQADLKQTFLVENRPGASGNIGMDYVAKSPRDGYTLLLAPAGLAANAHLFLKLPFDPLKDLAPIIRIADQPNVLIVNPAKQQARNVNELIAHLKAHPGKVAFGTSGVGNPQDISARVFMKQTGTDMLNVAYKGGAPALADLMGGHIDLMFETSPTAVPYVKSGKLRALAVTGDKRLPSLPDVPTVAEAGVPNYKTVFWMGLLAPAGTPAPVLHKLNEVTQKILASADVQKQLVDNSLTPAGGSASDFGAFIRAESATYARLVRELDIERQ